MSKKPREIDFRREAEEQLNAIRSRIGQEVSLDSKTDNRSCTMKGCLAS